MQRVLQYDGLLPNRLDEQGQHSAVTAKDVREMKAYIDAHRTATTPFDIIVEGRTPGAQPGQAAEITRQWAANGATWWIEAMWGELDQTVDFEVIRQRVNQGPPRFD